MRASLIVRTGAGAAPQAKTPGVHPKLPLVWATVALGAWLAASTGAVALDGSSKTNAPLKLSPQTFTSTQQALRAGVDDLQAGDAQSSVEALTYAAEGGEALARWKLGSMYATGEGVPRDDVMAYKYFQQLVDGYNEDDLDRRDIAAVSNAFVAIGCYNLTGIANSEVKPDPERALEMFQYAATNFGDPEAQYRLARMYIDGAAGLGKDNMRAARWLALAADKHHHGAEALLGHLLFLGEGVPRQRAKGLMWLSVAKNGAKSPKDDWIRDLYLKDYGAAADDDREVAATYLNARGKDARDMTSAPPPRAAKTNAIETLLKSPSALVFGAAPPPPPAPAPAQ